MYKKLWWCILISIMVIFGFFFFNSFSFASASDPDYVPFHWKSRWFILDGWLNLVYFADVAWIAYVWRPTANNRRFAMSDELAQGKSLSLSSCLPDHKLTAFQTMTVLLKSTTWTLALRMIPMTRKPMWAPRSLPSTPQEAMVRRRGLKIIAHRLGLHRPMGAVNSLLLEEHHWMGRPYSPLETMTNCLTTRTTAPTTPEKGLVW